jgi:hypothetical protein
MITPKTWGLLFDVWRDASCELQEKLPIPNISPAIEFVPDFPKLGYLLEFELLM